MLCACCGEDKAAACFSGSQKKRVAAARKCSACVSTATNATSNAGTAAPPLAAVAPVADPTGTGVAADADNPQATAPAAADGVAAAPPVLCGALAALWYNGRASHKHLFLSG